MKTIIGLIWIVSLAVTKADEVEDKADLIRHVVGYADTLKELLEENWTVEAKKNEIILTSKFDVFYVGLISPSPNDIIPEFSDKASLDLLKKASDPVKYVIRLRFEEPMSREELDRRRIERQKAADILNFGAKTKTEYSEAIQQYREIKIPTYSLNSLSYDIYQELPVAAGVGIFPPKAVQKIGGAKEILAVVLQKILTAHD